jgi:hypothetical protein
MDDSKSGDDSMRVESKELKTPEKGKTLRMENKEPIERNRGN